ncbi:MAG: radical SAM protein [Deltaproteobacteria bacterium]|nr:radical SAM protein [Deltaproteobacteria bacterium]
MVTRDYEFLPAMLFADGEGRIYDHPHLRMVGFSGDTPCLPEREDLVLLPEFSKLFFLPKCPPLGLNPDTGKIEAVRETEIEGKNAPCFAVAAFLEPGMVRTHLPAADYRAKDYVLPMWAYTAVGFKDDRYWAAAFRIEYNHRWDPRRYDDLELVPAIESFQNKYPAGPLTRHLIDCATLNHCFAAKNLFMKRWEAPLPVSRTCNAECLGCLSLQGYGSCEASHHRISFRPSREEIVDLAVRHLEEAPDAIVSFGQGCEGEPLMEYRLIAESIREIRRRTGKGTINLNTNGSRPERVREIARSGLDSIRISLCSARPEVYRAYTRPRGFDFEDVLQSISLSREMGLYTMVNYLVFPGISDQEEELTALEKLVERTGVQFIHLKNLCIDPELYLRSIPRTDSPAMGMRQLAGIVKKNLPEVELGYFNRAVR